MENETQKPAGAAVMPTPAPKEKEEVAAQPVALALSHIKPVLTPAEAKDIYRRYQEICEAVASKGDFVGVQGKQHPTKQFANKLARMFALSVEIVQAKKEDGQTGAGKPFFVWHIVARAVAPNGQYRDGDGHCATNERNFAHYHHDVYATAVTRAKNRAILELVGMGEVSAEEVVGTKVGRGAAKQDIEAAQLL